MKKIIIPAVLFVFLSVSLSAGYVGVQGSSVTVFYEGKSPTAKWTENDDGSVSKEGTVINGEVKVYAGSGKYRMFTTFKIKDNEIEDGSYSWEYKTGEPAGAQAYKNGKLNGPFKYYYRNGKVSREGAYKEGKRDGEFKWYYD